MSRTVNHPRCRPLAAMFLALGLVLALQGGAWAQVAPSDIWSDDPQTLPDTLTRNERAISHPTDSLRNETAAGTPCTVIRVKLRDHRVKVKPVVALGFPKADEAFGGMVARLRPTIAVTGTFFSTRDLRPIGDIKADGNLLYQGLMGTALALSDANEPTIRRVKNGHAEDWTRFRQVLACGPALVLDGRVDVNPQREGFRDPHVMRSTHRIGVGTTPKGEMLLVITHQPVSFNQWGKVMAALGCDQAMNLDAGASMAVHYRGRTLMSPSRKLTNLLCVYVDDKAAGPVPLPSPVAPHRDAAPRGGR